MKEGMREGLLDRVRAAPLDDAPRKVLADFFESSGELERAEFVRLQLEQARLAPSDPRAVRGRIRQRVLLQAHGEAWRASLPQRDGVAWGRFERGLPGRVAFDSVGALAAHGEECSRAAPLSKVILRWPRLEERIALAPIEGLQELTVVGAVMQPEDVEWLAHSPLLSTLRALNLVETQMEPPALRRLLASPHLGRLEALRLPIHNFGNEGVELLVQASLPRLIDLDLSVASQDDLGSGGRYQPTMDEEGAVALAGWPGLARLKTLDLTGNQIGADGLAALLSSPLAVGLKALRIRGIADWDWEGDGDKPDVLIAFGSAAEGLSLDALDISECVLTDDSTAAVIGSPALAGLQELRFNYTQGALARLLPAPWCDSLRILSANDCGEDGMRAVLERALPRLHTLSLSSAYPWSQARNVAEVFGSAPPQPELLELDLSDCGIEDPELEALGSVSSLPALLSLRLTSEDDAIGEEAAARFAASPLGARLESLEFGLPDLDRAPEPRPIAVGRGEYRGTLRDL